MRNTEGAFAAQEARKPEEPEGEPAERKAGDCSGERAKGPWAPPPHPRTKLEAQLNSIEARIERRQEHIEALDGWPDAQGDWAQQERARLRMEIQHLKRERQDAGESLQMLDDWLERGELKKPKAKQPKGT